MYLQRRQIVDAIEGGRLEADNAVVVQIPVKVHASVTAQFLECCACVCFYVRMTSDVNLQAQQLWQIDEGIVAHRRQSVAGQKSGGVEGEGGN